MYLRYQDWNAYDPYNDDLARGSVGDDVTAQRKCSTGQHRFRFGGAADEPGKLVG